MKAGTKSFIKAVIIFVILSVLTLFLIADIYISYNWLRTVSYVIETDKVQDDVIICLLADLHDHRFGDRNSDLVEAVRETNPDLILAAGDFINEGSETAAAATELIPRLLEIAPVYYSLGNQEKGYIREGRSDLLRELQEAGAIVLEDTYTTLEINGNKICLAGMYEYAFGIDGGGQMDKGRIAPDRLRFLEEFQEQDCFKIMMSHRPDSFIFGHAAETWDIDVVVSGHVHGGQVVLPFLGGLYAGDQGLFPRYIYGEYHFQTVKNMIITSGLGSDFEKLPRVNNLPEIVSITLRHH